MHHIFSSLDFYNVLNLAVNRRTRMRGSIKTRNTQVQFIRQGFRRNCSSELKQKEMNKNGERNIIARLYRKHFRHVFPSNIVRVSEDFNFNVHFYASILINTVVYTSSIPGCILRSKIQRKIFFLLCVDNINKCTKEQKKNFVHESL